MSLSKILNAISPRKILVAGDFLLDRYTIGAAKRVSPEAPVLVLNVESEEDRPGGAGNVVLNLLSLGSQVVAIGRVGRDVSGRLLRKSLEENLVDTTYLFEEESYFTPTKNRLIADRQQIVRVDHERSSDLSKEFEEKMISLFPEALEDCDAIALSDYGKGLLSDAVIRSLIALGREKKIPVIVDPKGFNYLKYRGCSLIKPNRKEALEVSPLKGNFTLQQHGEALLELVQSESLLITLGEEGSALFRKGEPYRHFSVLKREVRDVTGAGDTVLAALTLALACGLPADDAVVLGNVAAGLAVERFGCARISLSDLSFHLLKEHHTSKVFDAHHLFALKEALRGKDYHLVDLKGTGSLTTTFLANMKQIKSRGELLLIHPEVPQPALVEHLACLEMVDGILLGDEISSLLIERPPKQKLQNSANYICAKRLECFDKSQNSKRSAQISLTAFSLRELKPVFSVVLL